MIQWLMALALNERVVVLRAAVVLLVGGLVSFTQLDIEAYPDPVQPMTEVLTLPSGYSAEEVERLVTVPTEYGMSGMLHLKSMESISLYGLSDVRMYFDWESDYEQDRIQTIDQLTFVTLPQGIQAGLSPENPIGEIYRYTVNGPDHDLVREKEVEDWVLEKQLKTVPGVLDVSGFGGLTKEYHVELDPAKLTHYAIPLSQVITAIQNSNTNAGGNYLNVGEQAFDVRGIGLIHSLDDIRDIVLATNKSTPIRISNVGDVAVGWSPRLGIVGMNNQHEVVDTVDSISRAAQEVGGPMFYSTAIFLIAFLPLFTMQGVEGAIFSPMSHTYAYALIVAIVLAVMLSPVLCSYLLHQGMKETHNIIWEAFHLFYHNVFVKIIRWPKLTLVVISAIVVAGLWQFQSLGGEFLPKLEEGNIWAHAIMPSTIALPQGARLVSQMRQVFLSFPEVKTVLSQLGRPDDGTETTSFFSIEFPVDLIPQSQWPEGMTKERLVRQIDAKLRRRFQGVSFSYSQNIEDNIDEALSGVKAGANVVKVFGRDLKTDEATANRIADILNQVRGVTDVFVFRSLGQPNIVIRPNRAAAARYGLNSGDVSAIVQAAIGGQTVTQVLEGDRSFGLVVRWKPGYREDLVAMRNIRVNVPTGGNVPLGQIASVETSEGASFIYRGDLQRYVPVRFSVAGRDLQSAVAEVKERVAQAVHLPEGIHLEWVGEYGELQAANRRLAVVIPIALVLIMGILYAATLSVVNTLILMAQVPLACLGGVLALVVTGTPFSISAAVGFISIFAIAIMDGILLNFYIHQLYSEGHSLVDSIVMGADRRFRAVMMTALVDGLGLLPAALSTRIGAQTQRPLAIVVIGGALSIAMLTRVFQPTLMYLLHNYIGLPEVESRL